MEVVGDNLFHLEGALEKLSYGGRKTNRRTLRYRGMVRYQVEHVFDLTDAISRQDVEKALGVLEKVMESKTFAFRRMRRHQVGDPIPLLLSMMAVNIG